MLLLLFLAPKVNCQRRTGNIDRTSGAVLILRTKAVVLCPTSRAWPANHPFCAAEDLNLCLLLSFPSASSGKPGKVGCPGDWGDSISACFSSSPLMGGCQGHKSLEQTERRKMLSCSLPSSSSLPLLGTSGASHFRNAPIANRMASIAARSS